MIAASNLTKRYGEISAIDDVTFRVEKGEVLGFLGPNGAGKTTTMRILTGFIPATSGSAIVAGYDVFEQPREVKRRIGYLPETPPLYNELTVLEYLRFAAKIKGIRGRAVASAIDSVVPRCGLEPVIKRLIGNLSRGFRQRVGLAQALVHNPEVLILDEPTVGLDPKQIIEIRELIKGLAGTHTIILSTHILPEATALCQRVVIINKGRIVAVDTQERLSAQLRRSEKIQVEWVRPSDAVAEKVRALPGVLAIFPQGEQGLIVEAELGRDIREEVARAVVESGAGLRELKGITMTLEDVFLRLTTEENLA